MRHIFLAGIVTALLAACGEKPAPVAETPKPAVGSFGVDLTQMDATVRPGDDFYGYVNGVWLKTFQIPADRARYGTGTSVSEKTEADVRTIVEELAANRGAPGTVARKVGDLYAG
jgi:putative endopeptidase